MSSLYLLLCLPVIALIILIALRYLKDKDWENTVPLPVGILALTLLIVVIGFSLGKTSKTWDKEVWNGQVTAKHSERVSCEHSYLCNCHESCSGSGKDKSCSTVCDTCYEHGYDINWNLYTDIDNTVIHINRIDRQGLQTPPRFAQANVGDSVAQVKTFKNYLKAAKNNIFVEGKTVDPKLLAKVPAYPLSVYNYHYLDRVLVVGATIPNLPQWNRDLSNMLKILGPAKQANIIILITDIQDPNYYYAVKQKWSNAKKNDVVLILGVVGENITWCDVLSWTDVEFFKTSLRDDIKEIGKLDEPLIMKALYDNTMHHFKRKKMREFKYLESEIVPSNGMMIMLWIVTLLGSAGAIVMRFVLANQNKTWRRYYR
jgi:hypothetical protein